MKTIVIYHRADFDGIFCREIAKKFLPNAELIGWDYGDPVPEVPLEDMLYILDLSIEPLMNHPNLVWIDHHKSAMEKYPVTIEGIRIDGVAACRLTWQWFCYREYTYPTKDSFIARTILEPFAVRLAGEYDVWDRRDPRAELFQYGLRSQDLDSGIWEILLDDEYNVSRESTIDKLLLQGKCLQYAKTRENASIIKAIGFTLEWEGLTFLACNHAQFNSFLFTAGLMPEHEACLGFKFNGKGAYMVSLYHAPGHEDIDLSTIAKKYGGGGHRGACGFILTPQQLNDILGI